MSALKIKRFEIDVLDKIIPINEIIINSFLISNISQILTKKNNINTKKNRVRKTRN